jgi:hypothetical protein
MTVNPEVVSFIPGFVRDDPRENDHSGTNAKVMALIRAAAHE